LKGRICGKTGAESVPKTPARTMGPIWTLNTVVNPFLLTKKNKFCPEIREVILTGVG
jgi:hypothetical protein